VKLAHTLTISPDGDRWQYTVDCPHDLTITPGKELAHTDCRTYWECDCKLTDAQKEDLYSDGEGPCGESPNGLHYTLLAGPRFGPWRPSDMCGGKTMEDGFSCMSEVHETYGFGTFLVRLHWGDDGECVEVEPLAAIETMPAP
jgi:hypothetical protein